MRVSKAMLGAMVVGMALLSACGTTEQPVAAVGDTSTVKPTTTVAPPVTTTTTVEPTTTVAPPTTTTKPPVTTTTKPKPKPTTTTKPPAQPSEGTPCKATAAACIDLSANQSWLLKDGKVIYGPVPITHGKPGYRTPVGTFRVGWKDIDHKSSQFNNAPMPYSVFFNGGIAFHAGSLKVPSHGCIHLSNAAAQKYYNSLAVGAVVQVVA
ncbi:Putative secreted protein [Alloactinosynnema sp. L-07]|uniref:L,D-transpeptidase n=1 Tax=Alloactinosynnema sp. L-07 TaxID=1653480 RepID=UPI00065F005B|nr:L,D-transpeptidase [Alloactinosynnema sp. L-07]CRK61616.1 Putative secreted protein [Alloactinosynnema sp. L-07]